MARLSDILDDLLEQADKDPAYLARRELRGGLNVIVCNDKSAYVLILARKGAGPSDEEMGTVLRFWPYALSVKPEVNNAVYGNNWPALQCRIPRRLL